MCINQKFVTNPYTGQRLLVKCGKCSSCKQEKADRLTSRINNHCSDYSKVGIFSTLTYDEKFVPYVKKQDLENNELLRIPVYRDFTIRRFKDRCIMHPLSGLLPLDYISLVDVDSGEINRENIYFHGNLWKKGRGFHPEKMAIIYFKDVQDFKKRLRINLSRELPEGFKQPEIFVTSEYGETHFRPHFHILVFIQRDYVARVQSCICRSWSFASYDDVQRATQVGINPAAYVSSYVNSPTNLPSCFTALSKTKHSFTPSLGKLCSPFSLVKILEKANIGTLDYVKQSIVNGRPTLFNVPIPKYVINRFFPVFKGLCRLSPDSLDRCLRFPFTSFKYAKFEALTDYNKRFLHGQLVDDKHSNYIRLRHAIDYYCNVTGNHPFDFALDYQRVWNCYKNTLYKMSFAQEMPMTERYDNIKDLIHGYVRNDTLSYFLKSDTVSDFNQFGTVKQRTEKMSQKYFAKTKISKENNFIRVKHLNKNL